MRSSGREDGVCPPARVWGLILLLWACIRVSAPHPPGRAGHSSGRPQAYFWNLLRPPVRLHVCSGRPVPVCWPDLPSLGDCPAEGDRNAGGRQEGERPPPDCISSSLLHNWCWALPGCGGGSAQAASLQQGRWGRLGEWAGVVWRPIPSLAPHQPHHCPPDPSTPGQLCGSRCTFSIAPRPPIPAPPMSGLRTGSFVQPQPGSAK